MLQKDGWRAVDPRKKHTQPKTGPLDTKVMTADLICFLIGNNTLLAWSGSREWGWEVVQDPRMRDPAEGCSAVPGLAHLGLIALALDLKFTAASRSSTAPDLATLCTVASLLWSINQVRLR